MRELFEYIKARIESRVPAIKTVRMWNDQIDANTRRRNEKPFKYPACFVEFVVQDVANRCLGIKDYLLLVRFRFAIESYKFERLDTLDFCDDFSAAMHLMAPTESSGLIFTTFQETGMEFDENHDNVEAPYIEYRTQFRSLAAYNRKNDIERGPIDPNLDGVITNTTEL